MQDPFHGSDHPPVIGPELRPKLLPTTNKPACSVAERCTLIRTQEGSETTYENLIAAPLPMTPGPSTAVALHPMAASGA